MVIARLILSCAVHPFIHKTASVQRTYEGYALVEHSVKEQLAGLAG